LPKRKKRDTAHIAENIPNKPKKTASQNTGVERLAIESDQPVPQLSQRIAMGARMSAVTGRVRMGIIHLLNNMNPHSLTRLYSLFAAQLKADCACLGLSDDSATPYQNTRGILESTIATSASND
jgi:hypothetical protein